MSRSYLDTPYEERFERDRANRSERTARKKADQVKALRQTIVDMVGRYSGQSDKGGYRIDEELLQVVYEAGHDQHLLNRITNKIPL